MKYLMMAMTIVWATQAQAKKLKEGSAFPLSNVAALKTLPGSVGTALGKLEGKVVLVDFWASWCGPCKEALPAYDALYKKYGKNGFVVLGVNVDDEAKAGQEFLKEHKVSFSQVFDDGKKLVSAIGVETMPSSFLIDKKGKVKVAHLGFRAGDEKKMEQEVKGLLKTK